jgi:ribosomal protein L37AE/L43A
LFTKICPHCNKKSYSSSEHGPWICPQCKKDITEVPVTLFLIREDIAEESTDEQG